MRCTAWQFRSGTQTLRTLTGGLCAAVALLLVGWGSQRPGTVYARSSGGQSPAYAGSLAVDRVTYVDVDALAAGYNPDWPKPRPE